MTPADPRRGRPRRRIVAQVFREETICWLCGQPVDFTLNRQTHPMGATVDEDPPISKGGNPLDRAHCHLAHRRCNSSRGNRPPGTTQRATQGTASRVW